MINRRTFLLTAATVALARCVRQQGGPMATMQLSIHQNTSFGAGYRGSLEAWARAGIQYVELSDTLLDAFLETDTLPAARRVLADLELTPVSAAAVLPDIWIPGPERQASLETWRVRCEQFATLGLEKMYCPSITTRPVTAEDFRGHTRRHPRSGGDYRRVRSHHHGRVHTNIYASVDAEIDAPGLAGSRSSTGATYAGLLPLCLRAEQVRRTGPT